MKASSMMAASAAVAILFFIAASQPASAHFLGEVKTVDKYQVVFQPHPRFASVGQNATLNFSILENNSNINNVNVAMLMKEKESGRVVEQMPYRTYEFSDISIPYKFHNNTDYVITLLARIHDSRHLAQPLAVDFDISAGQTRAISPSEIALTVAPVVSGLAGIVVFLFKKRK